MINYLDEIRVSVLDCMGERRDEVLAAVDPRDHPE